MQTRLLQRPKRSCRISRSKPREWAGSTTPISPTIPMRCRAKYGTIGTEMSVKSANEAARFADVPGLSFDTRRKLDILRGGLVLAGADDAGRRTELNDIATRLQVALRQGQGHARRQADQRQRHRGGDGHRAAIPPSSRRCGRAGTTMSARRCAPIMPAWSAIANQGAKELGYRRRRRDVAVGI